MAADYLRYANQGATRNLPLAPQLVGALSFLPELGVTAEVFSGGQPAKGTSNKRVGSVRHDHGNAADVRFFKDGRQLDWARPEDRPVFEAIVSRGRANGLTGFGAGPGYMSPGTMHVGFGSPGVWGAGGKGANAPDWLRRAYEGGSASAPTVERAEALAAPGPTVARADALFPQQVASSTSTAPIAGASPMASNYGGLGGLGGAPVQPEQTGVRGFLRSDGFGDVLQAIGLSLLSSPNNAPLSGMAETLPAIQNRRERQDERALEREQQRQDRLAMTGALQMAGLSPEEAQAFAGSRDAAGLAMDARQLQMQREQEAVAQRTRQDFMSGLGSGVPTSQGGAQASQPSPVSPASGSGNRTFDALVQQRDQVAQQLVNAPDDETLARGKLFLDNLDAQIERYKPKDLKLETFYDDVTGQEYRGYLDQTTMQPVRVGGFKAPSGPMVSVNTGSGSDTLYEAADKARGTSFVEAANAGRAAQRNLIQIDTLDGLLSNVETGGLARIKQVAGEYGIATDGLDDIQAATALINQMVPAQRPPGSGTMSDADLALFKQSLPRLINQEGGNQRIINTMRGIAQYDAQIGAIANQILNREISPAEGQRAMDAIPNPLQGFRAPPSEGGARAPTPGTVDPAAPIMSGTGTSGGSVREMTDAELEAIINGQR